MISCSDFTYTAFEEFNYEEATIADNAKVKILSFSGGKQCTTEETYYYSIIVVVIDTEDTIRILTPCQLFSTKFPMGTFHKKDISIDSIMKSVGFDLYGVTKKQFVVANSKFPFQNENYKAIIGSLGFKDDDHVILKDELKRQNIDTMLLEN